MFFCKIKIACGNKFEEIGAKELLYHGFFEDVLFGLDDLQVSRIAQQDAKAMFGIHPALMTFNPAPLNYTIQAKILHYTSKILSPRIFKTSLLHRGHKFSMDLVNGLSQLPPYGGC